MGNPFSWLLKILKPGYVPKGTLYAPVHVESDLIVKNRPSDSSAGRLPGKAHVPASTKKPTAQIKEYEGSYKELPGYVDACYFEWMAGKSELNPISDQPFEQKIIEYLDMLAESELAGSNLIPRVPSVMVQLLQRMHEENVSGSELARIITRDVVLVAAILREVNNSFYNLSDKVTELSQAILLLGHNRLRMVLAKLSFTPVYNDQLGNYTKITAAKIWEESQYRALACYLLAKHQKVDPFMAFLAGLMQDVGLMVALRVFDRSSGNGELPTSTQFRNAFQKKALLLSGRIGQNWSIPELVIRAIEAQNGDRTALAKIPMARVLKKADFISKTCMLINHGQLRLDMDRVRELLSDAESDCMITMLQGKVGVANIL